ncbi:MAG: hypothetical protein IPG50_03555 [Myxococcales bacterium]|nr:hypothetical protein [Myxococcales bacterium]
MTFARCTPHEAVRVLMGLDAGTFAATRMKEAAEAMNWEAPVNIWAQSHATLRTPWGSS